MIEFFMPMDPPTVTQQEHKVMVRNGRPVFYDPEELKAAKRKLISHLWSHRPVSMLRGCPIELVVKWCFPDTDQHPPATWRITKPDTDNLQKMLKDCMTRCCFWEDDALVCREIVEKFWSDIPGIYIRIRKLEEDDGA